jgi:hypothetical protein
MGYLRFMFSVTMDDEPRVQNPVALRLRLLLGRWKGTNLQVVIRFQQN